MTPCSMHPRYAEAPADTAGLAFAMRLKVCVLLDAQWTCHTFDMGSGMQYVLAGSNIKHLDVMWGGGFVHACRCVTSVVACSTVSTDGSGHGSAGSCYFQPFAGCGVLALLCLQHRHGKYCTGLLAVLCLSWLIVAWAVSGLVAWDSSDVHMLACYGLSRNSKILPSRCFHLVWICFCLVEVGFALRCPTLVVLPAAAFLV